jgi:hypothetical protein
MQDLQTKSLWAQISGECIQGPLKGKKLDLFYGVHTNFADFKNIYPDGVLLKKPEKGDKGSPYDSYYADRNKLGIFGRKNNYDDLNGKEIVFGIKYDGKKAAVSEKYLEEKRFALLTAFEKPVLITYSESGNTVTAVVLDSYVIDNPEKIIFEKNRISTMDKENQWDSRTGQGISQNTQSLPTLPVLTSYWFAWISFFPDTDLVK